MEYIPYKYLMKFFLISFTLGALVHIQLQVSEKMFFLFSVEEKNNFFSTFSSVLPKEIKKINQTKHYFFLLMMFLNSDFIDEKLSSHGRTDNLDHKNMPTSSQ